MTSIRLGIKVEDETTPQVLPAPTVAGVFRTSAPVPVAIAGGDCRREESERGCERYNENHSNIARETKQDCEDR